MNRVLATLGEGERLVVILSSLDAKARERVRLAIPHRVLFLGGADTAPTYELESAGLGAYYANPISRGRSMIRVELAGADFTSAGLELDSDYDQ